MVAKGIKTCAATENSPVIIVPIHNMLKLLEKAHKNKPIEAKNINRGMNLVLLTISPIGTMNNKPSA